jgi:thiosulfate reductase cytochrome b subunit
METEMPAEAHRSDGNATGLVRRHSAATRLTHWLNAFCLAFLLMSGMQIYNAHPALYWGDISTFAAPLVDFGSFPRWATLPSYQDLASGRLWHFFFAWIFGVNVALYYVASILSGHFGRDLLPTWAELRHTGRSIREHLMLRFPEGEDAKRYNVLQKLSYLAVMFALLPLVIATGLSMSPGMNSAMPWLPELFGGRQSARTVHFIAAAALVAFFVIHIAMVVLSGFWNNIRSMITGRYRIIMGGRDGDRSNA